MAKKYSIDYSRLCDSIRSSRMSLRRFREERALAVAQYVGAHWSDDGPSKAVPANLIYLFVSGISRNLIAKNPRALITVDDDRMRPMIASMKEWVNSEIEHMDLAKTLERVVLDGLFSIGIAKVALGSPADSATYTWQLQAGSAFAECIDLDDYVYDSTARKFSQARYHGHRYRVPLDAIRDDQRYSSMRKHLVPSNNPSNNAEGDERIGRMGQGYAGQGIQECEDMVDLWEIWYPSHNLILTLPDDGSGQPTCDLGSDKEKCLLEQKWVGPKKGPYCYLTYGLVPGNAMPIAPVQNLIDTHLLVNIGERKLYDQTENQKTVGFVRGQARDDGERVVQTDDQNFVAVEDPAGINMVRTGGPDAQVFEMVRSRIEQFKMFAGNLDMALGLAPQSKTLGQDRLLAESGSRSINDLQERTVDFTEDVLRSLCWFWYHDPYKVMSHTREVKGLGRFQSRVLPMGNTPQQVGDFVRDQPFESLKIKIDPYSMQHQTPQGRLQTVVQAFTQLYAPNADIAQQQGVAADFNELFALVAELTDSPDIKRVIKHQEPPEAMVQKPTQQGGGQPGQDRTLTRTNVSEQTPSSQANQSVANMFSAEGEAA